MIAGKQALLSRVMTTRFLLIVISMSILGGCQNQSRTRGANLIFISLDTTRFDYVDSGWGAKSKTPVLKNFSKKAQVFEKAFVTIPETLPSHLSIFTSYYPHQLGVTQNHLRYDGKYKLIQEILKHNGYFTYGIISLMSLIEPGFWKGFDEFNSKLCSEEIHHLFLTADKISLHARQKLRDIKNKKFFMFVHFSDPHYPYGPPTVKAIMNIYQDGKKINELNPYKGKILPKIKLLPGTHQFRFDIDYPTSDFQGIGIIELTSDANITAKSENIEFRKDIFSGCHFLTGQSGWMNLECEEEEWIHLQVLPKLKIKAARIMYQQEVEYMDKHIGEFLQEVEEFNLFDNTIIAIFSDHGEGLGERDGLVGHVEYLNQQFIRVPLMIYIPGKTHKIITSPVSMSGLSSTVLELLNLKNENFQHSFINLLEKEDTPNENIYSFTYLPGSKTNKISIIKWPYQGIYYWKNNSRNKELYNLILDDSFSPMAQIDRKNLISAEREFFSFFLSDSLQQKKKIGQQKFEKRNINRKKLEKLKRLGYIN